MLFFGIMSLDEIVQWVLGHLGPIFIAVVFFILPILRGIKEQAAKKKQLEERGAGTPPVEEDVSQDRKAWEALMRGEAPTAPPAPPPVPQYTPPPIVRPIEGSESQPTLTGRLSDFDSASREDEDAAESTFDEESLAREMNDRLLREEMQRRSTFLAQEKEMAARKTVAPEGLSTIESTENAAPRAIDRSAAALLFANDKDRRGSLRRAIIAREVLGPPLALRTDRDALGPTAISN